MPTDPSHRGECPQTHPIEANVKTPTPSHPSHSPHQSVISDESTPALSSAEQLRYARQLILPEIGPEGQRRLKQARLLVVGAGGLGSPALLYLAAAGIGHIGIIDPDQVDLTNLQRQILYDTQACGSPKAEQAHQRLQALNPQIHLTHYNERLDLSNALMLIGSYDLILEGSDNFVTKYLVNDACVLTKTPYIGASVRGFRGMLALYATQGGPCYRCLFPEMPDPSKIPTCAEAGVLGTVPGLFGTLQAHEALRYLLDLGPSASGSFFQIDLLEMRFQRLQLPRDPECPICGDHPTYTALHEESFACLATTLFPPDASPTDRDLPWCELSELSAMSERSRYIDVRTEPEFHAGHLPSALHLPLAQLQHDLPLHLPLLRDLPQIVLYCQRGQRAIDAYHRIRPHIQADLWILRGGYEAWLRHHTHSSENI
ncbi:HesA/MoeB/ThiF family protein [Myxococcota bacterium]|nr:HesA/MoeB/ThiF family protein [Myxococcota bacterium]